MNPFLYFKALLNPKQCYHTEDSKLMLQLMEDRISYSIPAVRFIKERIRSYERFGYPTYGIY